MTETYLWIGVVAHEHGQKEVEPGLALLNHGKRAVLACMQRGYR